MCNRSIKSDKVFLEKVQKELLSVTNRMNSENSCSYPYLSHLSRSIAAVIGTIEDTVSLINDLTRNNSIEVYY